MVLASTIDFTLPLADPVLKFLLILLIILAAPLLLNKLRISYYGIAALSCPGRRDCFISCFSPDWKSTWRILREIVRKA